MVRKTWLGLSLSDTRHTLVKRQGTNTPSLLFHFYEIISSTEKNWWKKNPQEPMTQLKVKVDEEEAQAVMWKPSLKPLDGGCKPLDGGCLSHGFRSK